MAHLPPSHFPPSLSAPLAIWPIYETYLIPGEMQIPVGGEREKRGRADEGKRGGGRENGAWGEGEKGKRFALVSGTHTHHI